MQLISEFCSFGLLSFVVLALGLTFILLKWPQNKHMTFSQHVAVRKRSIVYYVGLFSIVLPLLLLFFIGWFTPTFQLPVWFNLFIIVACLTQYVCTLIPEVGGWKTKYHRILAGISATCLIPPMGILLMSGLIGLLAKVVLIASLIAMLGIIFVTSMQKGKPSHFLVLQSAYYVAFFIPVLLVSYF